MPLILAEFCGRWGCTWWEGIITVILVSLGFKGILLLLGAILLGLVLLLLKLIEFYEFISNWQRGKQLISNQDKFQQKGNLILPTIKFLNRSLRVAGNAITEYRQQQDMGSQADSQQEDTHEPDVNAVNSIDNEAVNNSVNCQPRGKRILLAAKFAGRTVKNIAKK